MKINGLIYVVLVLLLTVTSRVSAAGVRAVISDVSGNVQLKAAENGSWEKAVDGGFLEEGASIKTGPDGEANVSWGDGNSVKVAPFTVLNFEELQKEGSVEKSNMHLESGRVMAQAAKLKSSQSAYNISTPSAVAGVRGTSFSVESMAGGQILVSVLEGAVGVDVDGIITEVLAGFEIDVFPGETPGPPSQIPPARLNSLRSQAGAHGGGQGGGNSSQSSAGPGGPPSEPGPGVEPEIDIDVSEIIDEVITQNEIVEQAMEAAARTCEDSGGCIDVHYEF